jgi:hypothetical protein
VSNFERDKNRLVELAHKVKEIAEKSIQTERRENWRKLNSLKMVRPMVNVNYFMWWQEVFDDASTLKCIHPAARVAERDMLELIFHDRIGDDTVIEPWITMKCVYGAPYINTPDAGDDHFALNAWGLEFKRTQMTQAGGSWSFLPTIEELSDFEKMQKPFHIIDEAATAQNYNYVNDAIGEIIGVVVDRGPMIRTYSGSLLHDLCKLRGYEQLLMDIYENPEWLHKVLSFMEVGVRDLHEECEKAGDLRLVNTFNQTMTYCEELPDPSCDTKSVKRKQLWHFFEGQEFDCVSPKDTEEFCIAYHKRMAREYGMIAYGCCEDLTKKIPYLKQIPNLRVIAVAPWANVAECAEQIGSDYVMSYRPNPSEVISTGFDADYVKKILSSGLKEAKGCNVEINLKDVKTIRKDINAMEEWVKIALEAAQEHIV